MKFEEIYNNAGALKDVVNALLDFIVDSKNLRDEVEEYLASELEMSEEDVWDLVEEGIQ